MNRRTTYSLFLKGDLTMKTLQRIVKAFMVPVALLPIGGQMKAKTIPTKIDDNAVIIGTKRAPAKKDKISGNLTL